MDLFDRYLSVLSQDRVLHQSYIEACNFYLYGRHPREGVNFDAATRHAEKRSHSVQHLLDVFNLSEGEKYNKGERASWYKKEKIAHGVTHSRLASGRAYGPATNTSTYQII